jgi:chemotaxis protein CheX
LWSPDRALQRQVGGAHGRAHAGDRWENTGSEMFDALGEICNMVAGNCKNRSVGLGDGCMLSVPTVIMGANYSLHSMITDELRTVLLFEGEPVVLSLEIHN